MNLKEYLQKEHMTQVELSLRTWISKKHISRIVNWKAKISPRVSMKLHYVFWVDEFYFSRL